MFTVSEIKSRAQHVSEVTLLALLGHLQSHPGAHTDTDTKDSLGTFRQGAKPQR